MINPGKDPFRKTFGLLKNARDTKLLNPAFACYSFWVIGDIQSQHKIVFCNLNIALLQ
jgi:hypothetical protein